MYLDRLTLSNFKNYVESDLSFSPKMNCFVGDNGVGKTNILDAIHYLSLTKSYFSPVDSNSVRHGEDYFIVKGFFPAEGEREDEVYCGFQRNRRKVFKINSKEYERMSEHIGRYPVVMISPADSAIISEGSEERRKFMNGVISQFDRGYLDSVMRYNRALKNRNILLKDGRQGPDSREMLMLWEHQMVPAAADIHARRTSFVNEIIPLFQEYYNQISGGREKVELIYRSQLNEAGLDELFEANLNKDRALQYTTQGIHRDDLQLLMDGYPIRETGSQGQQKSYLVALKLAKFEYISAKGGVKPILLLDDIFDKFDAGRVEMIIELVAEQRFGQIFITDTHRDRLNLILAGSRVDYRLFRIAGGGAEVINGGGSKE